MKTIVFLALLVIAVPSFGKPVDEEIYDKEIDYNRNVKKGKAAVIEPDEKVLPGGFEIGIPSDVGEPVLIHHKPFSLHIDIPHIFDLKLFTGPQGHRIGIGILPEYAGKDVPVIKEKY